MTAAENFYGRGRVVVVGQGYVGLPLAMRAVEVGYQVVGYDTDERRIKSLSAGESYVEDIPDAQVAAALASGRSAPARPATLRQRTSPTATWSSFRARPTRAPVSTSSKLPGQCNPA